MALPPTSPAPGLVPVCLRAPSGRTAIYYLPPSHAAALRSEPRKAEEGVAQTATGAEAAPEEDPEGVAAIHEELEDARPETPQWPFADVERNEEPISMPEMTPSHRDPWPVAGPWPTEVQQFDSEQRLQLQMIQQMRMQSLQQFQPQQPTQFPYQPHPAQHQLQSCESYDGRPAIGDDDPPKNFALQALTEALDRAEVDMLTGGRSRASDDVTDAMRQCGFEVEDFVLSDAQTSSSGSTNFALKAAGEALNRAMAAKPHGPEPEEFDKSLATALGLTVNPAGRRKGKPQVRQEAAPSAPAPPSMGAMPSDEAFAAFRVKDVLDQEPLMTEGAFQGHVPKEPRYHAPEHPCHPSMAPHAAVQIDNEALPYTHSDGFERSRALIMDLDLDEEAADEARNEELEECAESATDWLGTALTRVANGAAPQISLAAATREPSPYPTPASGPEASHLASAFMAPQLQARTSEDCKNSSLESPGTSHMYIIPGLNRRKLDSMSRDLEQGRVRMPRSNSRPKVPPIERRPLQKRDNLVDFVLADVDPARATTPRFTRGTSMKGQALSTCYSQFPDRKQLTPRRHGSKQAQPTVTTLPPLSKKKRYLWQ